MVSALVPGGSSPGRGHCVVFLGKTQLSPCLSPPRNINGYRQIVGKPNKLRGSDLRWTTIPAGLPGGVEILLAA